ncbi:MAG TPA: ribulose-phosphate 3-epimerase [bacterium]|nr:ribulose-phosphate 3-epimerase [bacterium]
MKTTELLTAAVTGRPVAIAPSLLSADFTALHREVTEIAAAGARVLHLDVMDGHFVPNITFGPPLVKSLRGCTDLVLDAHLMISEPEKYIEPFAQAGSDCIVFHYEARPDRAGELLRRIRGLGKKAGIALKPKTPAAAILPLLPELDLVLIMTVEPGFGGQSFMADQVPKIRTVAEAIAAGGYECELEVDGGIGPVTAKTVVAAGANWLVAGNAVFGAANRAAAMQAMIDAVRG